MTTYIAIETESKKRRMDITITVFKQRRGKKPKRIGHSHYQTRSWAGAKVEANQFIAKKEGYTLINNGYEGIGNKSVRVHVIKI